MFDARFGNNTVNAGYVCETNDHRDQVLILCFAPNFNS